MSLELGGPHDNGCREAGETPSAVIDRISLVLDSFDGPGRLTWHRSCAAPGCRGRRRTACSNAWSRCAGCVANGRDYELGMRLVELGSLALHQGPYSPSRHPVVA